MYGNCYDLDVTRKLRKHILYDGKCVYRIYQEEPAIRQENVTLVTSTLAKTRTCLDGCGDNDEISFKQ